MDLLGGDEAGERIDELHGLPQSQPGGG